MADAAPPVAIRRKLMEHDVRFIVSDPDLRPAELNDLYSRIGWNESGQRTTGKTAALLDTSPLYVSARADNQLVGFGRVICDVYVAQLLDIITHPDFRRRGVARQVTQLLLANLPQGLLGVSLIDGSGYPELYESLGFITADHGTNRLMYLQGDAHK